MPPRSRTTSPARPSRPARPGNGTGGRPEEPLPTSVTPTLSSTDGEQDLPAWGVTREFRFGQFVELYDTRRVEGAPRTTSPIVLTADGDIVDNELPGTGSATSTAASARVVSLQAIEAENLDEAMSGPATAVGVRDVEELARTGRVALAAGEASVRLGPAALATLRSAEPVLAVAHPDGGGAPTLVRLVPDFSEYFLAPGRPADDWLAARAVDLDTVTRVPLDDAAVRNVMAGRPFVGRVVEGPNAGTLVRVTIDESDPDAVLRPKYDDYVILDLPEFLAAPVVPARDGRPVIVPLTAEHVRLLRRGVPVGVPFPNEPVGGVFQTSDVRFAFRGPDFESYPRLLPAVPQDPRRPRSDLGNLRRDVYLPDTDTVESSSLVATPRLARDGLPVAVLLPWRQTWTLRGFSRGTLTSSIALAPGEETTIAVDTWERRSKALTQSSETETEQSFDFSSTTQDTEDVLREMVHSNDFSAQAHADLDASYSTGTASIQLGAGGNVSDTQSLQQTARESSKHVQEATTRATTRVRSKRITTITETVEQGSSTATVRRIRNPNPVHTLTLNFHEVLAHYDVELRFDKPGVRVVVLVENPCQITTFDGLTVRTHENALRLGLLDASLADGFEACRMLAAYGFAAAEIRRLTMLAKQEREENRERTTPVATTTPAKPANPYAERLTKLLGDIRARWEEVRNADVKPAVATIADWKVPDAQALQQANRWLWCRLVAAKFGTGLGAALSSIANPATPEDAERLVAALPTAGSFPSLDTLGSATEKDKEDAGLYGEVASNYSAAWWWWYPRLKDDGLYRVDDGGLPAMLTALRDLTRNYAAKEAEGAGVQAAEAAVEQAKAEQDQATVADRLEMKFGAEVVGSATERSEALLAHLNEHRDYYRFILFQNMPPSEQLQQLMTAAPQLRVGWFEPRVVASSGSRLAVPLTPLGETALARLVDQLSDVLERAAEEAETAGERIAVDPVILPTPGLSVETWRGTRSAADDVLTATRAAELRRAEAEADLAEAEVARYRGRLAAKPPLFDDPHPARSPFGVELTDGSTSP